MLAIAGTVTKRPDKVASQATICPALSLSCAEIDRCPHVIFSSGPLIALMHEYAGVFTQTSSVKPNPFANVTIKIDVIFTFKLNACANSVYQAFPPPAIEGLGTRLTITPTEIFFHIYMYNEKRYVGVIVYFTVMFDHPSCFLTFCRSGIPTSCYIFNVFYYLFMLAAGACLS